jgi:voltage-gated potassium channel
MNWLLRRRFQALLIAVVLLIVVFPMLRGVYGERLLFHVLVTLVYLAALFAVFTKRTLRWAALLLGTPTLIGIWTGYVLPGISHLPLVVGFHLLGALFLGFCVVTILRAAFAQAAVSSDSVYGAFCGYVLIGLAFGHLYCVVEALTPGSFTGSEAVKIHSENVGWGRFQLAYFSFMTLTTVGYGDITPSSDAAKGLAMVEAIIGQFYIAVLVAELIGKRMAQALSEPPSEPKQ